LQTNSNGAVSTPSTAVYYLTRPTQPGLPNITDISSTSGLVDISVNFTASSTSTHYTLYYAIYGTSTGNNFSLYSSVSGYSLPLVITGLLYDTSYNIYATTDNSGGMSNSTGTIFLTKSAAPTNLVIADNSYGSSVIDVSVNFTRSSIANQYTVYYTDLCQNIAFYQVFSSAPPFRITGSLSFDTSYSFSVTQRNSSGIYSLPSSTVYYLTRPAQPSIASIVDISSTTGLVDMNVLMSGNYAALNYRIYYATYGKSTAGNYSLYNSSVSGYNNPLSVRGLSYDTSYSFYVTATNITATSAFSVSYTYYTKTTQPTGLTIADASAGSSTIDVSVNFTRSLTATSYSVSFTDLSQNITYNKTFTSAPPFRISSGLSFDTSYSFTVLQNNSGGVFSTPSTAVFYLTRPKAPSVPVITNLRDISINKNVLVCLELSLNFTVSTNTTSYAVYYSTNAVNYYPVTSPSYPFYSVNSSIRTVNNVQFIFGVSFDTSYNIYVQSQNSTGSTNSLTYPSTGVFRTRSMPVNLLTNGTFAGNINGWNIKPANYKSYGNWVRFETISTVPAVFPLPNSYTGNTTYALDLWFGSNFLYADLSQNVTTVVGGKYNLSLFAQVYYGIIYVFVNCGNLQLYDDSGNAYTAVVNNVSTNNFLAATGFGTTAFCYQCLGVPDLSSAGGYSGWYPFSFNFTATSVNTVITLFGASDGPNGECFISNVFLYRTG
jgi:hypothetical protein